MRLLEGIGDFEKAQGFFFKYNKRNWATIL